MWCDNSSRTVVNRLRAAFTTLRVGAAVLAGALAVALPGAAAGQALVIELSTAAPQVTKPEKSGPLIEIVELTPSKNRPTIEIGDVALELPQRGVAPPPVEEATAIETAAVAASTAPPVRLDARVITVSERRLKQLDGLDAPAMDAALERLERKGEVEVIAHPTLYAAAGQAASFTTAAARSDEPSEAEEPSDVEFRPYGADLTLRPSLGDDGSVRVAVKAEFAGEATQSLEGAADLGRGKTLIVTTPYERAAIHKPHRGLFGGVFKRSEPRIQLAMIVSAQPPGAAEPDSASEPAGRGVLAGAPRGPPKRTLLASVFAQAQKVLDPPYRTVRAGLAFVVRAGKSAIGRA